MQLIRELNRPAPVAAARPTAQLQLCARHANHETESEHPRRKPLYRSIQTLCPNRTYILLLLLLLLLIPLFLLLRLPLPADWTRACGRGVESCIIVLDNDLNTQQCVDNHLLNHHAMARGRFDRCHAINSRTQQTRACGRGKAYSSVAIMCSPRKPRDRIRAPSAKAAVSIYTNTVPEPHIHPPPPPPTPPHPPLPPPPPPPPR